MIRTYTELISIDSYLDRFEYLKLGGKVGEITFGGHRYLNQAFYNSKRWKDFKREVIIRDNGCDMAHKDKPFQGHERIIIHHLNPLKIEDVIYQTELLMDFENVVAVSFDTHQAIHYGDKSLLPFNTFVIRRPNDTIPWR